MLDTWSNDWLLKFNVAKCKIVHCGFSNAREEYHMRHASNETVLNGTVPERDLGVNVSNTLKATQHWQLAAKKAMSSLILLRMAFSS